MIDMYDTAELVSRALRRAWQLGQTYWQQADSEYQSHWKRADATQDTFNQLVEDTRAAILAANSSAHPAPSINPASLYAVINWLRNGCDPRKAADELEMFVATLEAKP